MGKQTNDNNGGYKNWMNEKLQRQNKNWFSKLEMGDDHDEDDTDDADGDDDE